MRMTERGDYIPTGFAVSPLRQSHFKSSHSAIFCATATSPGGGGKKRMSKMKMMIRPAKITHSMLLDLAKRAREDHERTIFLHYTWGHYGDIYDEFHLCIDKNGEIYRPLLNLDDRIDDW